MLESSIPSLSNYALLSAIWLGILLLGLFFKLIFPIYNIAIFQIQSGGSVEIKHASPWEEAVRLDAHSINNSLPDIYYIIVDGYGRSDLLKELFEYDNSTFLQFLSDRGFYVAEAAHSNYVQTSLSIASSLIF